MELAQHGIHEPAAEALPAVRALHRHGDDLRLARRKPRQYEADGLAARPSVRHGEEAEHGRLPEQALELCGRPGPREVLPVQTLERGRVATGQADHRIAAL